MSHTLILPLQSSGKMEVTPQQSEILQKELFKMGYCWWAIGHSKVDYTDKKYLLWENDETICFLSVGYEVTFNNEPNPLHLFDNHFKIEE